MMSSTVTSSKSRMRSSMAWRRAGNPAPSFTTVRSSSMLNRSDSSEPRTKGRTRKLAMTLMNATAGCRSFSSGCRRNAEGKAMPSGRAAATVFGPTSAKMRNQMVSATGAIHAVASPK